MLAKPNGSSGGWSGCLSSQDPEVKKMLRTFRDASVFIEIFDLNVYMRFRSR